MRTATTSLLSTAFLAALAGGCSSNSSMVERFDPAPAANPQPSANALPTTPSQARTNANNNSGRGMTRTVATNNDPNAAPTQPALRTGPVTPEWIAQMEVSGARAGAPAAKAFKKAMEREPFERSDLVFTAGTDSDTPNDTAEGLTQITFATEGADFDPRISRDGQSLVFASTQHRATADIYIKKIGGRAITQLTADPANDVMPALSPDGKRIAFASDRNGTWQLFVMGSAGGRAVQLSPEGACDLHPTWSPDGKRVAFCRLGQVSGRWEMWVVDAANPATAEFIGYGMFPVWCPASGTGEDKADKIAFQRGKERGDRAFGLWTIDYKPGFVSSPTEIVPATAGAAINPNWSPDGQFITYATVKSNQTSSAGVWIVTADGSVNVNLTSGPSSDMSPWWGKDGRVYFVSDRSGHDNIWSVGTERAMAALGGAPANDVAAKPANTANEPPVDPNAGTTTTNVPTNP
jgi:TolB protein